GSYVTSGYLLNAFDPSHPLYSDFAVAPGTAASGSAGAASSATTVVRTRAQYADYFATTFFNPASSIAGGLANGAATVPGPDDGGQLAITATGSLSLQGSVEARAAGGGQGGGVDISGSGSEAIVINDAGLAPSSSATSNRL